MLLKLAFTERGMTSVSASSRVEKIGIFRKGNDSGLFIFMIDLI
jgi:hypothetical protein